MGRRDGLPTDKPKVSQQQQSVKQLDFKTKSDIRGTKPTGLVLDAMRELARKPNTD